MKAVLQRTYRWIVERRVMVAYFLVVVPFVALRLPFFLETPLVAYSDTWKYLSYSYLMEQGYIPAFPILPPGYPVFAWLVGLISHSKIFLALVQSLTMLGASLLTLRWTIRWKREWTLPMALALFIILTDHNAVDYETRLIPESIYTPAFLVVCGAAVRAIFSGRASHWAWFSGFLLLPALIRSNGPYIYFLFFTFLFYLWVVQRERWLSRKMLAFVLPFVVLNLAWAGYNAATVGAFFPGNPQRLNVQMLGKKRMDLPEVDMKAIEAKEQQAKRGFSQEELEKGLEKHGSQDDRYYKHKLHYKEEGATFGYTFFHSFKYSTLSSSSLYYNTTVSRYHWFRKQGEGLEKYKRDTRQEPARIFYLNERGDLTYFQEKSPSFFSYLLMEYEDPRSLPADPSLMSDLDVYQKPLSKMLERKGYLLYHVGSKAHDLLFRNWLWAGGYFLSILFLAYQWFRSRFRARTAFLILNVSLIHLLSIMIIAFIGGYLPRYAHPTEFIIFLTVVLTVYEIGGSVLKRTDDSVETS